MESDALNGISNSKVNAISLAVVQNKDIQSLIGFKTTKKSHPITQQDIDGVLRYMDETALKRGRQVA